MYGLYCIVHDHDVLALVEDSFCRGRCSCDVHSQGRSALPGKERPCIDVRFPPSPLLYAHDTMTLASELGQKYATQNYPSQGTPICKLHGPSIKPRSQVTWIECRQCMDGDGDGDAKRSHHDATHSGRSRTAHRSTLVGPSMMCYWDFGQNMHWLNFQVFIS